METLTQPAALDELARRISHACVEHEPFVLELEGQIVVVMPLEDYESMEETAYLLSTPANTKRLMDAIAQDQAGGGHERELIE